MPTMPRRIERVRVAVMDEARAFWSDRAEAAKWRLDIPGARRLSVRRGLAKLGYRRRGAGRPHRRRLHRDAALRNTGSIPTPTPPSTRCASAGVRLALVTNGAAETQRAKIERFDLAHRFDHIQIEGEFGQGKPELAVYRHALERLGCDACDAWMVGDNYEWEVVAPQKLGMCGIWYDPFEAGVPAHATAQPTRVIKRLGELLE